jgi:hypothetical protein
MWGVLVGAALVFAFMRFRYGFGFRRFAWAGGGCHGGHGHHHGGFDGGGHRRAPRWASRWLFQRLETSPGQEKVILEAYEQVMERAARLREELGSSRSDLAKAVRGGSFDATALSDAQSRQDGVLKELREAMSAQLAQVHQALDERQRQALAELIEHGPRGRRGRW